MEEEVDNRSLEEIALEAIAPEDRDAFAGPCGLFYSALGRFPKDLDPIIGPEKV